MLETYFINPIYVLFWGGSGVQGILSNNGFKIIKLSEQCWGGAHQPNYLEWNLIKRLWNLHIWRCLGNTIWWWFWHVSSLSERSLPEFTNLTTPPQIVMSCHLSFASSFNSRVFSLNIYLWYIIIYLYFLHFSLFFLEWACHLVVEEYCI